MPTAQEKAAVVNHNLNIAFHDSKIARLTKLFWLALVSSDRETELEELIENFLDSGDSERILPKLHQLEGEDTADIISRLHELSIFGFICEFWVAEPRNIRYENGRPVSWSTGGIYQIGYAYGETPEELFANARKEAQMIFDRMVEADSKKSKA